MKWKQMRKKRQLFMTSIILCDALEFAPISAPRNAYSP